jgi:predicted nuclease of predicted toxin-antitoxin system
VGKDHLSDFKKNFESAARFLVDEASGSQLRDMIWNRGWNVRYVNDVFLLVWLALEVLAFAWRERRILLTHDFEFVDDSRFPFQHNPGLIVLPRRTLGLADAINGVLALIGTYFKACPGYKIRITKDGVWTIRFFT